MILRVQDTYYDDSDHGEQNYRISKEPEAEQGRVALELPRKALPDYADHGPNKTDGIREDKC